MSRPNGPVHRPGMAVAPEHTSDPYAPSAGPNANPNYAQHQPPHGQAPPAQSHVPPTDHPAYAERYGQPDHQQDYSQPQYPGAQGHVGQDPALSSWADVNQPVHQAHQHPNQAYTDPVNYAPQATGQQAAAPPHPTQTYQPPHQPTYDPAYTHHGQQPQPHYPQHNPAVPSTTPTAAPTGYDFASYDAPQAASTLDPNFQATPDQHVAWGQDEFSANTRATHTAGDDFGLTTQTADLDPHQQPVHVDDTYEGEDEDYEYEDERSGGRSRGIIVAAALAGAIVVGGSMAYGYQALFGPPVSNNPPVVKGAAGPAKVKPADPGGRKFAHTNSKIMGRLGTAAGQTNDPAGGARRVSTLRIGRDGSVMPPANPAAVGGGGPRMVTGMTLGGTDVATAAEKPSVAQGATPNKPIVVKPPAAKKPVKIAKVKPVTPKAAVKTVAQKPAPVAKPAPTKVALAKPAAPVATGPKPTGAGYVAVLASVPVSKTSRMDALKQFADMQQKYGTALQNKTPDVQRANLGEKGSYHRLIAGPPGSVQSARSICSSLKSAGYPSCWVLAY